jgi:hypothetical protein
MRRYLENLMPISIEVQADTKMPEDSAITEEKQRELLRRILASPVFGKSARLSAFLAFVCEEQWSGRANSINEQRIGVNVFGRPEGYHVGEDSIVRSQARFLRQRLDEYFSKSEDEGLLLTIPKGCYQPLFQLRVPQDSALALAEVHAAQEPAQHAESGRGKSLLWNSWLRWVAPAVSVACLMALIGFYFQHRSSSILEAKETSEARFWDSIFDNKRVQIIVPSDSSLVLLEEMSKREVPLADYMSRIYLTENTSANANSIWHSVAISQYTSLADLHLVSQLEQRSEAQHAKVQIRYARDLTLEELKNTNAILIGGKRSNPWVELFAPAMPFNVDYDLAKRQNFVWNRKPKEGEQERYFELDNGGQHTAYGVIAYLPSLDSHGSALLVGGTSKAGTEAAAEFLFNNGFASLLRGLGDSRTLPHFEILISTKNTNGESHDGKIVAFHCLDETAPE